MDGQQVICQISNNDIFKLYLLLSWEKNQNILDGKYTFHQKEINMV